MTQVDDFINCQVVLRGHTFYSATLEPRNQPDVTHHTDCSGLQCYAMHKVDLGTPQAEMSSFGISQWCHSMNTGMSITQALSTRGAWVFKGPNEGQTPTGVNGSGGHIAVSTGDGAVFAAMGRALGLGFATFWSDPWSYAAWPPGLDATNNGGNVPDSVPWILCFPQTNLANGDRPTYATHAGEAWGIHLDQQGVTEFLSHGATMIGAIPTAWVEATVLVKGF